MSAKLSFDRSCNNVSIYKFIPIYATPVQQSLQLYLMLNCYLNEIS